MDSGANRMATTISDLPRICQTKFLVIDARAEIFLLNLCYR